MNNKVTYSIHFYIKFAMTHNSLFMIHPRVQQSCFLLLLSLLFPMRRSIDNIEIKEPPITELNKKKSCLRKSCTTGCGCLIIFLIGFVFLLQFLTTTRTKELKAVPEHVLVHVPLYDGDAIEKIHFTSGKKRSETAKRLGFIPKLVASPILITIKKSHNTTSTHSIIDTIQSYLDTPIRDGRDEIVIEWRQLPAKSGFINTYYQNELKKKNFDLTIASSTDTLKQFTFKKDDENIDGVVYIEDNLQTSETDYVLLSIYLPSANSSSQ